MKSGLKAGFSRLLSDLQDPQLVARFQELCGVRGAVMSSEAGVVRSEDGVVRGEDGVVKSEDRVVSGEDGVVRGEDGVVKSEDRVVRGEDGVVRGEAGVVKSETGLVRGEAGVVKSEAGLMRGKAGVVKSEAGVNRGSGGEGVRLRVAAGPEGTEEKVTKRDRRNNNGVPNGSALSAAGESVKAKPLRRNSLTGYAGQKFLIENRLLYYLFTCGTELGNELFYISFFPFLTWNVDPVVARRLIVVWVWVMYVGQCTKDVIRWPRPASPPVVKVEVFYNSEYSMPSTHAMSGTAVPLALLLLTHGRWEYPFLLGVTLALSWCVLVCVSRVYMGMHSVLDVIVGFLYSLLILVVFSPVLDVIDTFNLTCHYAPILIVSLHAAMGLFSFTLDTWSTSRGDTAQILGTGAGIAVASHLNYQLNLIIDPPASMFPFPPPTLSFSLVGLCLLRFVLGVLLLLATRAVMKPLTIPLVCWFFGIPSGDVRKARQHMQVELPYRYIVYWTVGFSAFFLVPTFFLYIGLS